MTTESPRALLFDQLQDLFSATDQEIASLPGLVARVTSPGLAGHITRRAGDLQECRETAGAMLRSHGMVPGVDLCRAMKGLIAGGEAHLDEVRDPTTRDLMVVAHCLRMEAYGIAASTICLTLAARLGFAAESASLSAVLRDRESAAASLCALANSLLTEAAPPR